MGQTEPVQIADLSEIRYRADSIAAGARLAYVVFGAGVVYVAATWEGANRPLIAGLFAVLAAGALVAERLPAERIVRSRAREAFFLGWSFFWIAVIAVITAADGGAESPLALLFFLPLVFAALSYPLTSVVAIGAVCELTFVGIGSMLGPPDPVQLGFVAACLALTAVLCAWQAHTHDRRRAELALISRSDPLTGCLNRRGFEERVAAELAEALRNATPLAIVMLDLDRFKEINDTRGHAAGDELLRWTVGTIGQIIRPMDAIGRLGGDEFAVLLPGTGDSDALAAAERMRDSLVGRVEVTAGVACFPTQGVDLEELLRHADAELYAVKQGRARPEVAPGRRELSWAAALARAVDLRMADSDGHSNRVAQYAAVIGAELDWSENDVGPLRMAAMLHDVGKVSIPDRILRKPGLLDPEELEAIRRHPAEGAELVARVDGLEPILPWIRHAHEHFDGSGYPDGLSGEAIPPAARILLVADAYDAMTSDRPYSPAVAHDVAIEELRRCAGQQFDPRCVAALEAGLSRTREAA
jgi:diguanylate cyclase (GGDEF)-like protein